MVKTSAQPTPEMTSASHANSSPADHSASGTDTGTRAYCPVRAQPTSEVARTEHHSLLAAVLALGEGSKRSFVLLSLETEWPYAGQGVVVPGRTERQPPHFILSDGDTDEDPAARPMAALAVE